MVPTFEMVLAPGLPTYFGESEKISRFVHGHEDFIGNTYNLRVVLQTKV